MFYPFCNNEMLKAGEQNSFCANLKKTGVINIIIENKTLAAQFGKSLDEGFLNFQSDLLPSWDSFIQQENDDIDSELLPAGDITA